MAAYSGDLVRSASAVAIAPSVVYRLSSEKITALDNQDTRAIASILHQFVARLVIARLIFMNRRMHLDL